MHVPCALAGSPGRGYFDARSTRRVWGRCWHWTRTRDDAQRRAAVAAMFVTEAGLCFCRCACARVELFNIPPSASSALESVCENDCLVRPSVEAASLTATHAGKQPPLPPAENDNLLSRGCSETLSECDGESHACAFRQDTHMNPTQHPVEVGPTQSLDTALTPGGVRHMATCGGCQTSYNPFGGLVTKTCEWLKRHVTCYGYPKQDLTSAGSYTGPSDSSRVGTGNTMKMRAQWLHPLVVQCVDEFRNGFR